MKLLDKASAYFKLLRNLSLTKTIYVNYSTQKITDALKLPILVGKCVRIRSLGKIKLEEPIQSGMFCLGIHHLTLDHNRNIFILENHGQIVAGKKVIIRSGCKIFVSKNGQFIMGNDIQIGANTIIQASTQITVDANCQFSWNCQIIDSNMHFLKDLNTGKVAPREKSIHISKMCWIGNHVKIGKGVVLKRGTTVAANSVVTKGCSQKNVILAGIPATRIADGYEPVFNRKEEKEWIEFFKK